MPLKENVQPMKENIRQVKDKLHPRNVKPHTFFTIANTISLSRAFLAIPIALLLGKGQTNWAVTLMAVAVVTDWLDGYAARKSNEVSTYGKALDPIADKIVAFAVVFVLVFQMEFPVWFILLLGVRDFSITILTTHLHNSRGIILGANKTGKLFIFFATLSGFLWIYDSTRIYGRWVLYVAAVVMLISWWFYVRDIIRTVRRSPMDPVIRREQELS